MLNSGQKSSKFAHKCNLLSQYLKENGSFGDISLEMTAKLQSQGVETSTRQQQQQATTTMNLLPILENSAEDSSIQNFVESTNNDVTKSCFGSSASQMTIFYNGKVLVFNDFPAEKAKELMALAGRFGSSTTTTTTTTTTSSASALEKAAFATPNLNIASSSTTPVGNQQVLLHHQHRQARRASLHRFLEKRKDRVTAIAPYQVNNNSLSSMEAAAAKPEPTTPWLDLEFQSSKLLDLKL